MVRSPQGYVGAVCACMSTALLSYMPITESSTTDQLQRDAWYNSDDVVPTGAICVLQEKASKEAAFVPQAEPGVGDDDADLYSDADDMDTAA